MAEDTDKDISQGGAQSLALVADVAHADQLDAAIDLALAKFGRIDLLCSNAGIVAGSGLNTPDDVWNTNWGVNVMGHVHATRAVLPGMLERGWGHVLFTASAAGLLT